MKQLLLDLADPLPQTLDSFEVGANAELLHRLRQFAARATAERSLYLWGEPGVGKSHLLRGLAAAAPGARLIAPGAPEDAFLHTPETTLYLLDDCEKLSPEAQIAAFALFNQVRDNGGLMAVSGAVAPAVLPVRDDLRTRMGWGLVYHVHSLDDEAKIAALSQAAKRRGLTLAAGVLPYLITHFERDMRSLSALLDALDRYSLETKRPITLPLLRELKRTEM